MYITLIIVLHGQIIMGKLFHHHYRSPMTSKVVLGMKVGLGTSETWHILPSYSFYNGSHLVSGLSTLYKIEYALNPLPLNAPSIRYRSRPHCYFPQLNYIACDRVCGFNLIVCDIISCDIHLLAAPRCHAQCNNGISWAGHGSMCMFWSPFFFSGMLFCAYA